jgi:hypothetical protein
MVGRVKEPLTSRFPITLKGKLNGVITSNVTSDAYDPSLGRIPPPLNAKVYVSMDGKSNLYTLCLSDISLDCANMVVKSGSFLLL